ncbi:hypothetical protein L4D09_04235 [Photobacterium makurazakiensis]|uniref:hypothetical protein n=1 Tax=Photobacterium makurazakiensis TaxID=2910234 RepID=UPI003D0A466D
MREHPLTAGSITALDDFILTPETSENIRKEFSVKKVHTNDPLLVIDISEEELTNLTMNIFSFVAILMISFLVIECIRSFNGTS